MIKKLTVITDLHLRSDYVKGYLEAQVATLKQIIKIENPHAIVINGDIFHRRNPTAKELLAFHDLLSCFGGLIMVNRGNHDTVFKNINSESTVLSLFEGMVEYRRIFSNSDAQVINKDLSLYFIPHYDSEDKIIEEIKKAPKDSILFGHFGVDGCQVNSGRRFNSYIKKEMFDKFKFAFLGHIHTPQKVTDNLYILGTQYSTMFGDFNPKKYYYNIVQTSEGINIYPKEMTFGIKHLVAEPDEIEKLLTIYDPKSYFILLRILLNKFDSGTEQTIKSAVMSKYPVAHIEFAVKDTFDYKAAISSSLYTKTSSVRTIDMVDRYLDEVPDEIFSKFDLLGFFQGLVEEKNG